MTDLTGRNPSRTFPCGNGGETAGVVRSNCAVQQKQAYCTANLRLQYAVELIFNGPFCNSSSILFATFSALFSASFVASSGFSHTLFLTWMSWFAMRAGQGLLRHWQRSAQRPPERKTGHKLEVSSQVPHERSLDCLRICHQPHRRAAALEPRCLAPNRTIPGKRGSQYAYGVASHNSRTCSSLIPAL